MSRNQHFNGPLTNPRRKRLEIDFNGARHGFSGPDIETAAMNRTLDQMSIEETVRQQGLGVGRQLHDRMFDDILIRHERLVGELSRQQIETFVKTTEYLETRIAQMDKDSDLPPSGYDPAKSIRE